MVVLTLSLPLLVLFVSFGFMVGVLFGFFGMGGAFLITPTLLILGYPAPVAIGSGLAFYFGTSLIAVLKHHDVGQVNYKLGAMLLVGLTIGIEVGRIVIFSLEDMGLASLVTGIAYVVLLAGIGLLFLHRSMTVDADATDAVPQLHDIPAFARQVQSHTVPPMISLSTGGRASVWTISGTGGVVGLVSGMLGVGGGFLRMPAIYYVIGTPLPAAVGTSLFAGLFSGAFGTFTYGISGSVDLPTVAVLLLGSVLGARIGTAATTSVEEDDVIVYFGIMMLLASAAIGLKELGSWLEIDSLGVVSVVILVGSAYFVGGVILYQRVRG